MKTAAEWSTFFNIPIGAVEAIQLDAGAHPDDGMRATLEWLIGIGFIEYQTEPVAWISNGKITLYPSSDCWLYEETNIRIKTRRHVRILAELLGVELK